MKKFGLIIAAVIIIIIAVFAFLLSGTGPEDANPQAITITLDDNFPR